MPAAQKYEVRTFVASYEALGIVVDFLAQRPPYDAFRAARLVEAVKHQIGSGCNVCVVRGEAMIGYSGWLPITEELGRLWLQDKAELVPVPPEQSNAAALTIVCADDPSVVRALIRATRRYRPGQRVFFRRDYAGKARPAKRQTVVNVSSDTPGRS
jgi:hypothetical protein